MHQQIFNAVDIQGIKRTLSKFLGPTALVKPITGKLKVKEVVDKHATMEKESSIFHEQVVKALIFNRLPSPRPL